MRADPSASPARRALLLRILAWGSGLAAARAVPAAAQQQARRFELPAASDFAADGRIAALRQVPVLLFFDRADCPYCERALREYLVPMANDADWGARAIYRQIEVDRPIPLADFDGQRTTHRDFAAGRRTTLTPTVQVVDARGLPMGRAIVGLTTLDFYGGYLEQAITAGLQQLRGTATPR